jgi:hypothetical protein
MVSPSCFGITLPSSGCVSSAFWNMLNWGTVDRIMWMNVLCLVTWCLHHVTRQAAVVGINWLCVWRLLLGSVNWLLLWRLVWRSVNWLFMWRLLWRDVNWLFIWRLLWRDVNWLFMLRMLWRGVNWLFVLRLRRSGLLIGCLYEGCCGGGIN